MAQRQHLNARPLNARPGVSREYCLIFAALALGCVAATCFAWEFVGWFALLLLTPVLSCALLAVAYSGAGPQLLLKRASGRQSFWAWVLFAPYFLMNLLTLAIYRRVNATQPFVEVAPNLYLGRRLTAEEADETHWVSVLDLAAEYAEVVPLRRLTGYWSLPILGGTAPSPEDLQAAVVWITSAAQEGPVYVHCAQGHGRSACVIVAYLLSAGLVATPAEGVARLQSLRPGVRLHPTQMQLLESLVPQPHVEHDLAEENSSFATAG